MKTQLFTLVLLLALGTINELTAQSPPAIPEWVLANWSDHASGSGVWVADNSAFKTEQEPFEQYGTQWTLCADKKCLRGRLFGSIGGKEVATFWEFFCFWDAAKNKIRIIQVSIGGAVGEGWIWLEPDGSTKSEQRFVNLDGSFSDSGHVTVFKNDSEMSTQSFDISGGTWTPRRQYKWIKAD